ncbi:MULTISPECIES: zinc metalloprotease [Paenibacillus]|uniref:hypothetical protein n=1 Tax=Paenibacillus TaxID=44249 RepID=UPI0022B884B2|nr:hypothetical protein [Paenibacillus caseinilyticus]MCZ8520403.1 hypothetical protein [Paenibacillus caseinilyticus]
MNLKKRLPKIKARRPLPLSAAGCQSCSRTKPARTSQTTVRCLVLSVYAAPDSILTQALFTDHVNRMIRIWRSCGIYFSIRFRTPGGAPSFRRFQTGPIVNPGTLPCDSTPFNNLHPYFRAWLSYRPDALTTDIAVYYVKGPLVGGSIGCAPFSTNSGPAVVVTNGFSPTTLAHEIGHVLGLGHVALTPENTTNLMYPVAVAARSLLTAAQCAAASRSSRLQNCRLGDSARRTILPDGGTQPPVYRRPNPGIPIPRSGTLKKQAARLRRD